MPLFPSEEWMAAYCAAVAAHPEAAAMAAVLDGVYRLEVEPQGRLAAPRAFEVQVAPGPVVTSPPAQPAAPRLTITAGYDRWVELVEGRLDIGRAFLLRRVRARGDTGTLVRQRDRLRPLLDSFAAVDSTFL